MVFSDYIIYADESGSPVLAADTEDFPIFVLVFLLVRKDRYCAQLVPTVQRLKFDHVGHDQLILHERDIRRQGNQFAFLQVSAAIRESFIEQLNSIVEGADIELACAIIDKRKLRKQYENPWSPYDLALTFCMEKVAAALYKHGERNTQVNVVFESRGHTEDQHLELEFRRIADGKPKIGSPTTSVANFGWSPMFVDKRCNSTGLQIADLAARPLGLSYLRPTQPNRAATILRQKMIFPHPKVFP